ncbi:hypothetical protein GCM10011344_46130 [Dokdonia pacifica]|uniref:Holin-X, holin superfamily III n=1 Tax=Dokdonia pacifica TaxID=1627892 RepID=A0A239DBR6_9FLAO|nr:hypothetical protein [Dokdonia pacifica]GGG40040.1 hypothetical protein GCM10011344_46130 [Dokdonia pacifica]SNS29760.1 hypothetical protein SAMN06265376_11089 [Dokdonia pacifica]
MANCNEQQCKQILKELARSNARVKRRKERRDKVGNALGITAGLSTAAIIVWISKKAAVNAIPVIGWVIGGSTVALLATYIVLFRLHQTEINKRDKICQRAHDVCDNECLPGYCR